MTTNRVHLTFTNAAHRALHDVLLGYGFSFEVKANLQVGLNYWHDRLKAELALADELRAVIKDLSKPVGRQVITADRFLPDDAAWLDAATTEHEYLSRELCLLLSGGCR